MKASTLPWHAVPLRHSRLDALFVLLAACHGAVLALAPSLPVVALGVWWSSNTVSHNFIHKPFFRRRWMNAVFSFYLSVLLGIPQSLWRERHLAHHAGARWRLRISVALVVETAAALGVWTTLAVWLPSFFLGVYLPGYALGLALCGLHGYYEHVRGTQSHYGRIYNLLFFNDGYHVEHHRWPGSSWDRLPERMEPGAAGSPWPPVLRWLDAFSLRSLEVLALRSEALQRFLVSRHERAFRILLAAPGRERPLETVTIVGGGLFPRTVLVLRRILPAARLTVVDLSRESIDKARAYLLERGAGEEGVEFVHARYDPGMHGGADLIVVPLAYMGDRKLFYQQPPARAVLVQDWIWRRNGKSAVVSPFLLKRVNLIVGAVAEGSAR